TTTEAPSAANRGDSARPMPDAPPVTTATFPASSTPGTLRQPAVLRRQLGSGAGQRHDLPLDPEGAAHAVEVDAVDGDEVVSHEVQELGLVGAAGVDRERAQAGGAGGAHDEDEGAVLAGGGVLV